MERLQSHFEIAELVTRFLEGKLSPDESGRLESWMDESEEHRQLWRRLTDPDYLEEQLDYWHMQEKRSSGSKSRKTEVSERRGIRRMAGRKVFRYAAVVLIFLMAGFAGQRFLNRSSGIPGGRSEADLQQVQIMPRGKVAQLVLGSGRVVNLADSLGETLTERDGTKVHNGGKMLYYTATDADDSKEVYNTLIIPRGGEYQVTLSDGTRVWLNAASSLRYPTRFGQKERKVFLSGEGYFEVAKDEQHPFIVETGSARIKVLGTKFNVSAYKEDSRERIALAEGAVSVGELKQEGRPALLKPGYGAVLTKGEGGIRVDPVNIEAALAWKNGMFIFDSESLGSIMKKLSRWYDVDISYENNVDTLFHFTGRIRRYENISGILHLMELTGKVKFNVTGHEVEISSK